MTNLGGSVHVDIGADGRASVSRVARCASVWACPVCAPNIRARRAKEIAKGIQNAHLIGAPVFFVTATVPHRSHESLSDVMDRLQSMYSAVWSGRAGCALRQDFGLLGTIRAIEVTHGDNGWHPHVHALVIGSPGETAPSDMIAAQLAERVGGAWHHQFVTHGYAGKYIPGVSLDVRVVEPRDDHSVAEYVSDPNGWDVSLELTRADIKKGRGVTAQAILGLAMESEDDEQRWLSRWIEYERSTKGRRFVVWSRGLKDRLGVTTVDDDEGAADNSGSVTVASFDVAADVWLTARRTGTIGVLLQRLIQGIPTDRCARVPIRMRV